MDILGKLFGSENKVKIMRLFLFNPETPFTVEVIADRVKAGILSTRQELATLGHLKLIKTKSCITREVRQRGNQHKTVRHRVAGFVLNPLFPYMQELQRLLLNSSLLKGHEVVRRLSPVGKLKLVIVAGLFIQDTESRLDILVVGDHLKKGLIERQIKNMESEIGKELRYAAFETNEFNYRLGLYDKLVRDVLDYPHKVVFDRLGLPPLETCRRPTL